MKSLRKILAVLVATAMVAGMGAIAFAGSITIKPTTTVPTLVGRDYTAYKILNATIDGSGSDAKIAYSVPKQMINFFDNYAPFKDASGSGVQAQAIKNGEDFSKTLADKIYAIGNDANKMQDFVNKAKEYIETLQPADKAALQYGPVSGTATGAVFSGLDAGYYLVTENNTTSGTNSFIMLDTVDGNIEINVKANQSKPEKKIVGASGSGSGSVVDASGTFLYPEEANNATVGSTVNFVLEQTVPNHYGYDGFYFIINDTLSDGLTFNNDIQVYIDMDGDGVYGTNDYTWYRPEGYTNSGTAEVKTTITKNEHLQQGTDYKLYTKDRSLSGSYGATDDNHTFEIAFVDIKNYPVDAKIRVTYSATVNSSAVVGKNPNTNESNITFTNNPSGSDRGDSGTNHVGKPDKSGSYPIGTGSSDWTNTFTTQITVYKVDGQTEQPLEDVGFALTGQSSEVVVSGGIKYEKDPSGSYWLLKDGTYTTTPPSGTSMGDAASGATSGYVKVSEAGAGLANKPLEWITLDGIVYRPYENGDKGKVYVLNEATTTAYDSTVIKYKQVSGSQITEGVNTVDYGKTGKTNESGTVTFSQLGKGTYVLSETEVPSGYNKAGDIQIVVDFTAPSGDINSGSTCTWNITSATQGNQDVKATITEVTSGTYQIRVVNNKGVELPSTGGIGTTIFYAGGAILVLLAGILLVSKRRFA